MSHRCEAVLITCVDFRLHQRKPRFPKFQWRYLYLWGSLFRYIYSWIAGLVELLRGGRNCVSSFIRFLGIDCDIITRAGGVQDILRPESGFDGPFIRDLSISHALHEAKIIIVLNHEDCGAYAGFSFSSRKDELNQHHSDIEETLSILNLLYPGKMLIGAFAELKPGTKDDFQVRVICSFNHRKK